MLFYGSLGSYIHVATEIPIQINKNKYFWNPMYFHVPITWPVLTPHHLLCSTFLHPCLYPPSFHHMRIFQPQTHVSWAWIFAYANPLALRSPPFTGLRASSQSDICQIPHLGHGPSPNSNKKQRCCSAFMVLSPDHTLSSWTLLNDIIVCKVHIQLYSECIY